ncbi:MAG: putative glyoxalase superfamily metalloenzyme YdcJ, partial [Granulosicoccus sp.]
GEYYIALGEEFAAFPDHYNDMRLQNLAYFYFSVNDKVAGQPKDYERNIKSLIDAGHVRFDPVIYEDFLPVSAAGIFQSNLGSVENNNFAIKDDKGEFECALGSPVECIFTHYETIQTESIDACLKHFSKDS